MHERVYRPTIISFLPYLGLDLMLLALAIGSWIIYFYKSSWLTMAAAVVFSLITLWSLLTSYMVFTKGVTVTTWGLEVSGRFISRGKIGWEDIGKVILIEKFRGYLPPARTDRMILIFSRLGGMRSFNSNAWPRDDEEEFLKILHEQGEKYGFKISRTPG